MNNFMKILNNEILEIEPILIEPFVKQYNELIRPTDSAFKKIYYGIVDIQMS